MKGLFLFKILLFTTFCLGQCTDPEFSTIGVLTEIDEQIYNDDESVNAYSIYSWVSDDVNRILSGNGIPNHEVGTFPNPHNPNTISEQNVNETFSLCPELISDTGEPAGGAAGAIAYAINSVKFDPGTAGRCNDQGECSLANGQGNWSIEALGHNTFDFGDDMNHAHVQPSGEYHYHGIPELLIDFLGNEQGMTLVGWASDGFPVYARYGYSDPNNSNSSIINLQPSWKIKENPDDGRPDTLTSLGGGAGQGITNPNIPIPMGAFTQDFEYEEGYGDLDQCNGRIGVTPEFPDGIYYYVVTDDFPFFSRCLKGDFANSGGTGGGVPNCEDVPPGMPCCGDGICGGPETEDNCPLDCGSNNLAPSLINFEFYGDTINTNQESVNIGFLIEAEDNDSYLATYTIRLNINGGLINGGETIEVAGDFDSGLSEASSYGIIQVPLESTEGVWNIRVLIEDDFGLINNFGPTELSALNFQSYIYVDNSFLDIKNKNIPEQFYLSQNYPNPFNPNTIIKYFLPKDAYVEVTVYDILGNRIKELVNENQKFGTKVVTWDAKNNRGLLVPAGVYLLTVEVDNAKQTKKMILLK